MLQIHKVTLANGTMIIQVVVEVMMTFTSLPVQLAVSVEGEQILICLDVQKRRPMHLQYWR